MNISQAIRKVSTLKGDIKTWSDRLRGAVSWREDQQAPAWNFDECLKTLLSLQEELVAHEAAIAAANAKTTIAWQDEKISLAKAIRILAQLKSNIALFTGLVGIEQEESNEKVETRDKYNPTTQEYDEIEKKHVVRCALPSRKQDALVRKLQSDFDELNSLVEGRNHSVKVSI